MFIDLHCDTVSRLYKHPEGGTLLKNTFDLDLTRFQAAGGMAQVFALFWDAENEGFHGAFAALLGKFSSELSQAGECAAFAGSFREYSENREKNRVSAFLAVEGAELLDCDPACLPNAHSLGVRIVTLTWNRKNALGSPAVHKTDDGLTPAGFSFLEELNHLQILPDISHLNDRGALDVLSHSKRPVIASHSNAREVFRHPRNLSDELIRAISKTGGIIGLNFYGPFLSETPCAKDIARHARHIANVGGTDILALGGDFDGMSGERAGLSPVENLPFLAGSLQKAGFSEREIDGIFYKNAERLFLETL